MLSNDGGVSFVDGENSIIAIIDGQQAGYVGFDDFDDDDVDAGIHIDMVEIYPEYRRQGIGLLLLKKLAERFPYTMLHAESVTDLGEPLIDAFERETGRIINVAY